MRGGIMDKDNLKNLTNEELYEKLNQVEWLDRDLLREYDERSHDGRIPEGKTIPLENLEEHIRNKYASRRNKKAS